MTAQTIYQNQTTDVPNSFNGNALYQSAQPNVYAPSYGQPAAGVTDSDIQDNYNRNRNNVDQAYDRARTAGADYAKYFDRDRDAFRTASGSNGLDAQASYINQWRETDPLYKQSMDAWQRSQNASGAAAGDLYSGGNAIRRSVGAADLENRLWQQHKLDLGDNFKLSQAGQDTAVATDVNYLTNVYPSLQNASFGTQFSRDAAEADQEATQAAANQAAETQRAASENALWGSVLGGGLSALGTFLGGSGGSTLLGALFCHSSFKENITPLETDGTPFLDRLDNLQLCFWQYNRQARDAFGEDEQMHLSPMAEDWSREYGGDGVTINKIDAFGVTLAMLKELKDENERLRKRVEELEK